MRIGRVTAVAALGVPIAMLAPAPAGASAPTFGPQHFVSFVGTSSTGFVDAACPAQAAFTRFHIDADTYVNGLPDLYCNAITVSQGKYVLDSAYDYVSGATVSTGTLNDIACPAGSVLTGANGRIGGWLDQLQMLCSPLHGNGSLGTAVASTAVGGTGGTPASAVCPAATMAISMRLYTDATDGYIAGIGLVCSGIVRVGITPASGRKGTHVTLTGANYKPGEMVKVTYATRLTSPKSVTLCSATVQSGGSFHCTGTIPSKASGPTGAHTVTAAGQSSGLRSSTTFKLTS